MNTKLKKFLQIIFSVAFWIAIWGVLSYKVNNTFLFPSPKDVFVTIFSLVKTSEFWLITFQSIGRILFGILFAVIIGILAAILTTYIPFLRFLVTPIMSAVKATPVASFIFIAIIFIDRNTLPVFITLLLVLPIIWTNVSAGIQSIPNDLRDVARVYKLTFGKKITKLYIPSILPYFLAACRSALGMAWKAGVAAEVLCTPNAAIGTELYLSKTYLETDILFAWTLITVILSLIIEKTVIYSISKFSYKIPQIEAEVRV